MNYPLKKDETEVVGIDLNVKHNFCAIFQMDLYDYDRVYIKQVCDIIAKSIK